MTHFEDDSRLGAPDGDAPQAGTAKGKDTTGLCMLRAAFSAKLERFRSAKAGTVAMTFAVAAPFVVALSAAAVEYASVSNNKSQLQAAVDAAALAATRELSLSNASDATVGPVVNNAVRAHLHDTRSPTKVGHTIDRNTMRVTVEAYQEIDMAFGELIGIDAVTIGAQASAQAMGQPNLCVLALHPTSSSAISLASSSRITGNDCAVFSNSTNSSGMRSLAQSVMTASAICSSGGYDGGDANFKPAPFVDCPQFEDPLAFRQPPAVGACDHTKFKVRGRGQTVSPGVYCGGISVNGNAEVEFLPGVYIIKDGQFKVGSHSDVTGTGVGFYLAGDASFSFGPNSRVSLEAPVDGEMAGMLFFSDRAQSGNVRNDISSNFVRTMVGTIYLPRAELLIRARDRVADASAYTAIVVNRLNLEDAPNLVLNTNYDQTAVPVPAGIRGATSPIRLIE